MQKICTRVGALFLAMVMALSLLPLSAMAAETGGTQAGTAVRAGDNEFILTTDEMSVQVSKTFPQVYQYTIGSGNDAKVMYGQTDELNTVKINGVDVIPKVTSTQDNAQKVTYTMVIDETNNNGTNVNATITAELRVELDGLNNENSEAAGRTLGFFITQVEYAKGDADRLANPVESIEIPNHSLLSVSSSETGAAVTGARPGGSTYNRGDVTKTAASVTADDTTATYFAAFVYNNELSASLASNSEVGTATTGNDNNPVRVTYSLEGEGTSAVGHIALSSTLWYWDRKVSSVSSGEWENQYIDEAHSVSSPAENEKPFAKVVITGQDENQDGKMDWQDGAVAYRDTVMHIPVNSELVPEAVNMRISMNFGSQAQNPFLLALDNVKRVAANTDGLGQMVLLKGYASEGHDSGHPDYDNIGERMGGVEDFKTMLREGNSLGAQFGVHVNASEFYPEAKAFDEKTVGRYNTDQYNNQGQLTATAGSLRYGWNWLDQGVNMNVLYDFASGNRAARFKALFDLVGSGNLDENGNREDGLSFIYVDVWGNNQHGVGDTAWMTRKITNEITNNTGWRITHEWSYANLYDSTFQHWTSDYTYGNYTYKGYNNSNVLRFLLNSYKDSFPADFATFGGACNAPLLGGPAMQGFEGWQKDDEYDLSIYNTFNQMVYTKFLQHYDIMQWVNAENSVNIPYNANANGARTSSGAWTPEMQIVLQDGQDKVVVTRGLDKDLDTTASFDNETAYRSRVITLNGKVILEGAPASAGEDPVFPASSATLKYLIPWYWNAEDGKRVDTADEKLYHWNANGGASTWDLPDGWTNLSTVIYYELSDQGRGEPQTLTVSGGQITLPESIKKNTAYVVVKGESAKGPEITYSTGLHVEDASFNVDIANGPWTVTGTATREKNAGGISVLKLNGEASVSQEMTGLVAGQKYAVYVGVDNLAGKASIKIADGEGNVVASNYTDESIAINYVSAYSLHTRVANTTGGFRANGESRFQNMYVFFTPEQGKTYTLTLSHENAAGGTDTAAYFDDVRTVETEASNFTYDVNGEVVKFEQDFEHVAQGQYPFVVGHVESVEDNRQHLSELHAPYTQAGWDVKKMDDVLEGNWSVKVNGLSNRSKLVMQTIPQNFRFEPDETYIVSFKYQMGSAGIYQVVVGNGAYSEMKAGDLQAIELEQGMGADQDNTCTFVLKGSESGQTWFGIYSTNVAPDLQGTSGNAANFGGYQDFVLDNLVITHTSVDRDALIAALELADPMESTDYTKKDGVDGTLEEVIEAFESARENAHEVLVNPDATQDQIDAAVTALTTAMGNLEKIKVTISGTVTDASNNAVSGAQVTLEDAKYIPTGLTAITGVDGTFRFENTDDVELGVRTYQIRVQADGFEVTTVSAVPTQTNFNVQTTAALTEEFEAEYEKDFEDSTDISAYGPFDYWDLMDDDGTGSFVKRGIEDGALWVQFYGWQDGSNGEANNLLAKDIRLTDGTISFDITPDTSAECLGITLRGTDHSNRIYIGQDLPTNRWYAQWWKDGQTGRTAIQETDIAMESGVTRRVTVTMDGVHFTVKLDGITVFDDDLPDAPTEAGYVGINMLFSWDATPGAANLGNWGSRYDLDNLRIIRVLDLQGLYDGLKNLEQGEYSDESFAALQTALTAAKAVLDKGESATVTEIAEAYDNLLDARDALVIYITGTGRPASGTTTEQPFASGTAGSDNFRIPALVTLSDGTLVAASDARWNHAGDACALDTIVSISKDNGETWTYNFPNYFNDSTDEKQSYATAFIDPVMVRDNEDNIYLVVDLFPGGVALNTAPTQPDVSSGYVDIDGVQRMAIYETTTGQTDDNYSHYVGDFANGYAPILVKDTGSESGYYVDDHYYLYQKDGTGNMDALYCEQLGSTNTYVQQNVFYYNADLHVRNATYLWMVKSTDGGETWSAPKILNPQVRTSPAEHQFYGVGPGAGLCLDDGTIMIPCYTFKSGVSAPYNGQYASFIYSTDGGETWTRSETSAVPNPTGRDCSSESALVQIDENTVRQFCRDLYTKLYYVDYTRDDSGVWHVGSCVNTEVAKTYNNQLSAILYSKTIDGKPVILLSTAAADDGVTRENGKIYTFLLNDDGTMTLENTFVVTEGYYAYSSLTELKDGSIGLLYENAAASIVYKNYPILDVAGVQPDLPANSYTVTFNSNGGSNVAAQTVDENGKATKPADPTKAGFTFEGWYTDEALTEAYDFDTPVTADITLYAKWTEVSATTYTVTFNSNGGSTVDAQTVAENGKATEPADPTKAGFTFEGWYTDEALTEAYDFEAPVTANITLYAKWTEVPAGSFTVIFNSNGGSAVDTQIVAEGGKATKPADPTRDGYTFEGWYSDEALTEAYDFGADVTANITLYAKWTEVVAATYTVTFNSNGGSDVDAQTVAENGKVTQPADPTRDGYTFDGWYTDEALTEAYDFEAPVTANITLYAKWTEEAVNPPAPPAPPTPPTTTETKENEDGTTTTIVTDNRTGTVTETTEKDDGTVEIVETQKDGTVTETTKNTDGSVEVVETKPDGTVTETATDPEGGKVEKVTNPDKDVAITVTDKDGEVLAEVELPAEIPASETRFVDVPEGHWADEAIHNMAALEVVNGIGNDRYDMNGNMTRGALATVLSRLSNGQEGLDSSFADVASDVWYADGIAWAAKTGVVTGYSETEFGPEDSITREQLAVMLCRYARLLGIDTTADTAALNGFNDGSSTHDWAADSIAWCVANGILQGKGNATLAPTATATRAEVAVMLQRFIDLMK